MPTRNRRRRLTFIMRLTATCVLAVALQSCFTGVEGTSKITMSKKETVAGQTKEDLYLSDITNPSAGNWTEGKRFLVADSKFSIMISDAPDLGLQAGDTIYFEGLRETNSVAGEKRTLIGFTSPRGRFTYPVEKPLREVTETTTVADIPMLIDLDIVEAVRERMKGKDLWTRTALWYGDSLQYVKGKKFDGVRVTDVAPGNSFFPLRVKFTDGDQLEGQLLMNLGNTGNESRSFSRLFYLTDPRNSYRHISPENWAAIQREELRLGMTKEESRLAKGTPQDVNTGHDYSNTMEIWTYADGTYLQFVDGLLVRFK